MVMDDRFMMAAIRRRQDEISSEVARNRLRGTLSPDSGASGWRRVVGRLVIGIGRFIEGD
jgi:hypothetical protein